MINKLLLIDSNRFYSYKNLFEFFDDEVIEYFSPLYSSDIYEIIKMLFASLVFDQELILADGQILNTTTPSKSKRLFLTKQFDFEKQLDLHYLSSLIERKSNWKIKLFTSGSTGLPKGVTHSINSILRGVKLGESYSDNVWGFTYDPTHIAGVQVLLQAILNSNTIVNLFQKPRDYIFDQIKKFNITHLSGTSTFYRLLLPTSEVFPSVRKITFGGEKFDSVIAINLLEAFPNATIKNIYASTEAGTLFIANNDIFTVQDSYSSFIKLVGNELCIRKELLGILENNESSEWYHTGDVVEVINSNPLTFRFLSRASDIITVGGNQINLIEIEDVVKCHENVRDARVYHRPNSVTGNIIICDVVSTNTNMTEHDLRQFLNSKLSKYQTPRIINFCDSIAVTKTGKKNRL